MAEERFRAGAILVVGMTVIVMTVLATSLLTAYQRVPNGGEVRGVGVGVYWESACTNNVTSIDWGFLELGAAVNQTVYIRNEGNVPLMLNMTTEYWTPTAASENITLDWNCEGYVLNTSTPVTSAVLTLSVSPQISGVTSFSFDIIVAGTELT